MAYEPCYHTFKMNFPESFPLGQQFLVYLLFLWSLMWKGMALWNASKHNQRNWFIVLLILNTIGILEIVYLFRFAKKRMTLQDIKNGLKNIFYSKSTK
jgi:hypothetical protein